MIHGKEKVPLITWEAVKEIFDFIIFFAAIIAVLVILFQFWWPIPFIVIGSICLWIYTEHLKDIWYGYGKLVGQYYNSECVVSYDDDGWLEIRKPNGSSETYMGSLGKGVYKLMQKNKSGIEVKHVKGDLDG